MVQQAIKNGHSYDFGFSKPLFIMNPWNGLVHLYPSLPLNCMDTVILNQILEETNSQLNAHSKLLLVKR